MSRHFTATILLERPWPLDIDALACAVRTQFPQIGTIEAVPGQAGDRDTGVLTLDGAQIVIQSHDRGSHDEMRPPLKTLMVWDPSRALRRHRAPEHLLRRQHAGSARRQGLCRGDPFRHRSGD